MDDAPPTPLRDAATSWLHHLRVERGVSANTLSAYRRDIDRYVDFLAADGIAAPQHVQECHVEAFLRSLREGCEGRRPLAASSAARTLVAVRGLHAFLELEGAAGLSQSPRGHPRDLPELGCGCWGRVPDTEGTPRSPVTRSRGG